MLNWKDFMCRRFCYTSLLTQSRFGKHTSVLPGVCKYYTVFRNRNKKKELPFYEWAHAWSWSDSQSHPVTSTYNSQDFLFSMGGKTGRKSKRLLLSWRQTMNDWTSHIPQELLYHFPICRTLINILKSRRVSSSVRCVGWWSVVVSTCMWASCQLVWYILNKVPDRQTAIIYMKNW